MKPISIDFKSKSVQLIIAFSLVGLLGFVLYIQIIFIPSVASFLKVTDTARKTKQEIFNAKQELQTFDAVVLKHTEAKEKFNSAMEQIADNTPSILKKISDIAIANNVRITSTRPLTDQGKANMYSRFITADFEEQLYEINAESGYHSLGMFIYQLEKLKNIIKIRNIAIRANKNLPFKHTVELTISIFVKYEGVVNN